MGFSESGHSAKNRRSVKPGRREVGPPNQGPCDQLRASYATAETERVRKSGSLNLIDLSISIEGPTPDLLAQRQIALAQLAIATSQASLALSQLIQGGCA